jgi:hypothetical protein
MKYILKHKGLLRVLIAAITIMSVLAISVPSLAETTAVVTVTYQPKFIGISINPTTWTINGITGDSLIDVNTTYYANPLGDTTAPTGAGAVDGECRFTITNTSTIATDIKVTSADSSGGTDPMVNSNAGTNAAGTYGAKSYFTGQATAAWAVSKSSGTGVALSTLAATTNIKCGMIWLSQSDAFAGGTQSTFTATFAATAHS